MTERLNLNTASAKELTDLPGVGPAIAARIVETRPFQQLDELQNVAGIGAALYERLAAQVFVEETGAGPEADAPQTTPPPTEASPAPDEAADSPEGATDLPEAELPIEETVQSTPTDKPKPVVTRGQALFYALFSGLLAFILSTALVLGVLVGLNGDLRFVRPDELAQLNRQIDGLQMQADIATQDIEGLRTRLNNLEDISDQVAQLSDDLAELSAQAESLNAEVETLQTQTARYDEFFTAFRTLLNNLFEAETP